MDTSGNSEHVGNIECVIRVTKERVRAVRSSMLCTQVLRRIIVKLVTFCVFWLNSFSPKGGLSRTYSLCTILLATTFSQRLYCNLPFDSYTEVHDNPTPPNNIGTLRTTPAICLGPTGNSRDTYCFFSLNNGTVIRCYQWTELPLTP